GCGFRLLDSQSGQRLYPAPVLALQGVPGEGFVFEAQILISAARELGYGVVSVPVETRYAVAGGSEQFRNSHFRLFRDLSRITTHVLGQVPAHGQLLRAYRGTLNRAPVIFDPDAPGDTRQP